MRFYLDTEDAGAPLIFPVEPDTVEIVGQSSATIFESSKLGQIAFDAQNQPERVRWSGFLPDRQEGAWVHDFRPPGEIIQQLETWRTNKSVRHLRVTGTEISLDVRVESFARVWGAWATVRYTLELVRASTVRVYLYGGSGGDGGGGGGGTQGNVYLPQTAKKRRLREVPRRHVVAPGDTLFLLAKRYLGSGNRQREIADLNRLGRVARWAVAPGTELKIPAR